MRRDVDLPEWFESFFDRFYYETYSVFQGEERNEAEARFIVDALGIKPGMRVLDLACGYARHAVYLARWGLDVVCYDLSPYLLERARERIREFNVEDRVEVVRGDMRSLPYREEFDAAYLFYTSFGFFSDEDNMRVLQGLHDSLRPGGRLLIDQSNTLRLIRDAVEHRGSWRIWYEAGPYIVLEESRLEPLEGRLHVVRDYLDKETGRRQGQAWFTLRAYTPWELINLINRAGMRVEKVLGSRRGEEYQADSPRIIVIARKP